jgi:hypothetical protein
VIFYHWKSSIRNSKNKNNTTNLGDKYGTIVFKHHKWLQSLISHQSPDYNHNLSSLVAMQLSLNFIPKFFDIIIITSIANMKIINVRILPVTSEYLTQILILLKLDWTRLNTMNIHSVN